MTSFSEHVRTIRSALKRLDLGDSSALEHLVQWELAQVWARDAAHDYIHIPLRHGTPGFLVVHRFANRVTIWVTEHAYRSEVKSTALFDLAVLRTVALPMFPIDDWIAGEVDLFNWSPA